jgi:hypothetical protein
VRRLLLLLILGLLASGLLTLLLWRLRSAIGLPEAKVPEAPTPWLLFLLPLPAALAAIVALAQGSLLAFVGDLAGYGLLLAGALAMRRGLAGAADKPWKAIGAGLAGVGAGVTAWLGAGHDPAIAMAFALLAAVGAGLCYGIDLRPARPARRGLGEYARDTLVQARASISAIEQSARAIRQRELAERLARIVALARAILQRIEDDPRDLYRARKFLNVYLDGVRRIVAGYAKTHTQVDAPELEDRFRLALMTVEDAFATQRRTLLKADVDDLDVQIEVLTRQLEREGIL